MGGLIPHYVQLTPGDPFPSIAEFAPFKAVVILNAHYSGEWQDEVSRWLVDSGCRYMLAWGPDCTTWDDSVDYASIIKHLPEETPDSDFVMTTWHSDQTLEDVFWQAQFNAQLSYDDVELNETVLLDVSRTNRERDMLTLWEQSKTLAEREQD